MYNTGSTVHKSYECMFSSYESEGENNNLLTSYRTYTSFIDKVAPTKS